MFILKKDGFSLYDESGEKVFTLTDGSSPAFTFLTQTDLETAAAMLAKFKNVDDFAVEDNTFTVGGEKFVFSSKEDTATAILMLNYLFNYQREKGLDDDTEQPF